MTKIHRSEYGDSVSWLLVDGYDDNSFGLVRGSAEFTLNFMVGDVPYVFFNRLVINPVTARGHGYGSMLMAVCMPYFDERRLTVLNPMNPYDPDKTMDTLRFFRKWGFKEATIDTIGREEAGHLLVRTPQ